MTLISNLNSDCYNHDRPGHSVPNVYAPSRKKEQQVLFKYKIVFYIGNKNLSAFHIPSFCITGYSCSVPV